MVIYAYVALSFFELEEDCMQTLRVLIGTIFVTMFICGSALADNHEGGDDTGDSGDSGDTGDEAPAPEPAPAPAPEPEPEPAPAPAPAAEPEPVAAPEPAAAPAAPKPDFKFNARDRARFVIGSAGDGDWGIENLASVGLSAGMGPVSAHVEVRDSRAWGQDGDGWFRVQQAWAALNLDNGVGVMVGRMEKTLNNGRLVSERDFTAEGNPFYAASMWFSNDKVQASVTYLKRSLSTDDHLIVLTGGPRLGDPLALDVLAFVESVGDYTRATIGANAKGSMGMFGYEVDGYGQFEKAGEEADTEVEWLLGVRAGVNPDHKIKPHIGGGIDVVSEGFSNLLGGNYGFFGHGGHVGNQGLIDGMVNVALSPYSAMRLNVDLHFFVSPWADDDDDAFAGFESDIEATWTPWKPLSLTIGAWIFVPGGDDPEPQVTALVQSEVTF